MYKVLLVDDDVHILNANETYLARQGYQVSRAENGELALRLASSAAFDAIVLDVDMPGMDGVTVCRRLREVSGVPIIFLSAYARTDDRIRGLMAGGDDYIGKPYSLVELELRLRLRIQRHKKVETSEILRFGGLEIDLGCAKRVSTAEAAPLTALEFDLARLPRSQPGPGVLLRATARPGLEGPDESGPAQHTGLHGPASARSWTRSAPASTG